MVLSELIGLVPPHVGEQPPPSGARMKASWKAFWPVASMTAETSGGELSSGIRYGAEAYQVLGSAAVALGAALLEVASAMVVPAASASAVTGSANRRFKLAVAMDSPRVAGGKGDSGVAKHDWTRPVPCQGFRVKRGQTRVK
ncbi:hypothetical protein GCM10009838_30550 [Catenulispora subtropica]|uniref:Uncharacterized protein n=1 Tax=Catenulispora subtropica TaxID=450798 RepID=A0ABP5CVP6_9ACTN